MIIFSKFVALGSYMCPNCKYAVNTDKKMLLSDVLIAEN